MGGVHDRLMVTSGPGDEHLRFHVEHVFKITGRGTTVIGYIETGRVAVGDRLRVVRADGEAGRSAVCTGVEDVRMTERNPEQPVPIGLIIPGFQISDIESGDFIVRAAEVS